MGIEIQLDRPTLPVLCRSDVVVAGGSFAGVAAALAFARGGLQVALVEPRTYLGREVTATLRPWISADASPFPEPVAACVQASGSNVDSGEIPLQLDAVKRCLEDLLLGEGVKLLYASIPVTVLAESGEVYGLVIGNKSGRQVMACQMIVDATVTAAVARAAGAFFVPGPAEHALYRRTLEFDNVLSLRGADLPVSEDLGLAGDGVTFHRGYRGEEHVYVECGICLSTGGMTLEAAQRRETEARQRTMHLAAYLISRVPAFYHAFLAATSYELYGPHVFPMVDPAPGGTSQRASTRLSLAVPGEQILDASLGAFAGPVPGLWCLQEGVRLDPEQSARFRDPVFASLAGTALAESLIAPWDRTAQGRSEAQFTPTPPVQLTCTETAGEKLEVREPESPQRGRRYEWQPAPRAAVPVLRSTDVLVVGGGTSGATAAITAAREGARTVLLEMNPGLGGTGTLGGVDSYWFGRRVGFAAQVSEWVEEVQDGLQYEGHRWNVEAKQHALLREAERAGVETFHNVVVSGALAQGNRVRGVVVATRYGLYAILTEVVVDATGDGDVAAFAGAEAVYGSARDHLVMWYSLAQFETPGRTRNNFTSMVDVSNVEDYTRAILAGRRRGENCHDHGVYVAPRESRHILGDVVLTLMDQLIHRRWLDVINVHFSNHDVKGHTTSDWLRVGLIPPNLEVEIPYRALLPRGLDRILVVGKALSATHDALPTIRMQADLENLGGAAALAAVQAWRKGVALRDVDVAELQRKWVESELLPEEVLTRTLVPRRVTDDELQALVSALDADRPLYAYSDMEMDEVFRKQIPLVEICTTSARAVPILEHAFASADGRRRVLLAQALSLCGSRAGVPALIDEIERLTAGGRLPARESYIRHVQLPPDQGAMPDVVYLIYALGMARDRHSLPVWERLADLLDVSAESIRDRSQGVFYYVDAICYGAERLGDPAAIPILIKLHAHAPLRDQVVRSGFQADFFAERQAMLELIVGRALARCGSPLGFQILINYLDDVRALLAEHAHAELVAITGQDHGKDAQAWENWLAGAEASLEFCPVRERPVGERSVGKLLVSGASPV